MYRMIHTSFWEDPDVIDKYSPEDRYFYLYLLTNPHTHACGIYTLPLRVASFETGYSVDTIKTLLERFESKYGTIVYNFDTQEIAVLRFLKYNIVSGGKPILNAIERGLQEVKDKQLIEKTYHVMLKFWNESKRKVDGEARDLFLSYKKNEDEDDMTMRMTMTMKETHPVTDTVTEGVTGRVTESDSSTAMTLFDSFWQQYPNKAKKELTSGLWMSMDMQPTLFAEIMTGLQKWIESAEWAKDDGRFIPHPNTWLSDKRWLDDPPAAKKSSGNPFLELLEEERANGEVLF